jgi:hypothetical protein
MSSERRIQTIARHIAVGGGENGEDGTQQVTISPTSAIQVDALYRFLVRDNVELREVSRRLRRCQRCCQVAADAHSLQSRAFHAFVSSFGTYRKILLFLSISGHFRLPQGAALWPVPRAAPPPRAAAVSPFLLSAYPYPSSTNPQDPLYRPNYYLSMAAFRELTSRRMEKFVEQRFFSVFDYKRDPLKFQAALECLSFCDYSLAIKDGVHFTLCGGTILSLGTEKHWDVLRRMDTLDLPGCFAMTELGHGSNVAGIETIATYDAAAGEFIIHTPNNEASKFWIGGSAETAKVCAVFAQLTVGGKWEGPHVFVVRLRDDAGRVMPGVRIADNGPKQGKSTFLFLSCLSELLLCVLSFFLWHNLF